MSGQMRMEMKFCVFLQLYAWHGGKRRLILRYTPTPPTLSSYPCVNSVHKADFGNILFKYFPDDYWVEISVHQRSFACWKTDPGKDTSSL